MSGPSIVYVSDVIDKLVEAIKTKDYELVTKCDMWINGHILDDHIERALRNLVELAEEIIEETIEE